MTAMIPAVARCLRRAIQAKAAIPVRYPQRIAPRRQCHGPDALRLHVIPALYADSYREASKPTSGPLKCLPDSSLWTRTASTVYTDE